MATQDGDDSIFFDAVLKRAEAALATVGSKTIPLDLRHWFRQAACGVVLVDVVGVGEQLQRRVGGGEERDLPGCIRRLHEYLESDVPYPARITVADNAQLDRETTASFTG